MEMLNNVSMLLAKRDLWTILIDLFTKWIPNYGWMIIVFTIALKLILVPLDIYQRVSTKKQQSCMSVMQPEMQAIQAKYGNDKEKINQETAKLYKKYNVSMGGMCLPLLLTFGVTMIVFFTLFSSLRSYGNDKLYSSYKALDKAYVQTVQSEEYINASTDEEKEQILEIAIEEKYKETSKQNSWLWVKNVWKSDSKTSQFVNFDDYAKYANLKGDAKAAAKDRYKVITTTIDGDEAQPNGYYVLLILSVVITFLTQLISTKLTTPKGQKLNKMNLVMIALMPILMISMAISSNVIFTLYIIINSVMSAIITTILTLAMRPKNGKEDDIVLSKKNVDVVEYSRNYKK